MKSTLLPIALALLTSFAQAAAPPTELKDAAGKTIIQYVVEHPDTVAPASTTDPARQLIGRNLLVPREQWGRFGIAERWWRAI